MGSNFGHFHQTGPCANCGKEGGAIMGNNTWGHHHMCCSRACGVRLGKKIENGMTSIPRKDSYGLHFSVGDNDERLQDLRIRIKQLEHRLRRGIDAHLRDTGD